MRAPIFMLSKNRLSSQKSRVPTELSTLETALHKAKNVELSIFRRARDTLMGGVPWIGGVPVPRAAVGRRKARFATNFFYDGLDAASRLVLGNNRRATGSAARAPRICARMNAGT